MSDSDSKTLENMVRKVLTDILAEKGSGYCRGIRHVDKSGILSVSLPGIKPEPFNTGKPGDKVFLKDCVSLEESPRLGFGVMEMDHSRFKWTLNYDEVDYIIDGRLEILIDGRSVAADKGEVIFIPKGSTIEFSAPEFVRFLYVVYPANWAEQ
ncbi:MAG: cupin domain-containing protein [Spirochaetaceae bacterium]|jgi:ethanolamine utilization protein EutQ|nr:cupin domain-containing protein [Spirochaetaceae bacterium]